MQSRGIVLKVAGNLDLANDPAFWGVRTIGRRSLADPTTREDVLKQFARIVIIVHEPKTEIVDITATTTSPLLSSKIVNELINEYIAHIFQVRFGSTERVTKWLVSQLDDLKRSVESDQEQLVNLQDKLGVLGLDQKSSAYLLADSLEGITKATGDATVNRILAEARLKFIENSDPNLLEGEQPLLQGSSTTQAGLLSNLRNSEAEAKAHYADLSAKFGPDYPDVKQAKARLDALDEAVNLEQKRIFSQARQAYSAARANEQLTEKALNDRKQDAFKSHDSMVRFVILQREYESDRVLYEGLMQRLRVAGINAGLESAQVDVVDLADVPTLARRPSPTQWVLICAILGLVAGSFMAIVLSLLDTRLGSVEEATKQLGLPLFSILPLLPEDDFREPFPVLKDPQSSFSQGMQLLRNSTLLARAEGPPKIIMITSTVPSEGKSTISRNMVALLASYNARVLLVDADLHKSSQNFLIGGKTNQGLSKYLSSSLPLNTFIHALPTVQNGFFLPTGSLPPNPATLLASDNMKRLLDEARTEFDFVVLDLPPSLSVADPILIAPLADLVVFVVRENVATSKQAKHALSLLRRGGANLGGFVMNGVSNRRNPYGSYYYKYGDSQGSAKEPK